MFNVPEKEVGEAMVGMTLEDQSPSVHQMALGLSIILFRTMVENECDGTRIISLSDALTALIDFDRTDLAMSLMIGLLGEYGMGMPSGFMQYAVFGSVANSGHVERRGAGHRKGKLPLVAVPFVEAGRRDHAALMLHAFGKHGLFRGSFRPRVDDQRLRRAIAPDQMLMCLKEATPD